MLLPTLYGVVILISAMSTASDAIQCTGCGPSQSSKADCQDPGQTINCSTTTFGCLVSLANVTPPSGSKTGNFYVLKKCYFDKKPEQVNACWDDEITTQAGERLNATTCICTTDLCNSGTLEEVKARLAPTPATSPGIAATKSGSSDWKAAPVRMFALALSFVAFAGRYP